MDNTWTHMDWRAGVQVRSVHTFKCLHIQLFNPIQCKGEQKYQCKCQNSSSVLVHRSKKVLLFMSFLEYKYQRV